MRRGVWEVLERRWSAGTSAHLVLVPALQNRAVVTEQWLECVGKALALLLAKFKDAQKEVLNGDGIYITGDAQRGALTGRPAPKAHQRRVKLLNLI